MRKKLKSHRGAAKRFIKTGSGALMRMRSGKRHLLSHKSSKRRRSIDSRVPLPKGDVLSLKRLLPYMK